MTAAIRFSPSNAVVLAALLKVKKDLAPVRKTKLNPVAGNMYADFKAIMDVVDPLVLANDAMLVFGQSRNGDVVECVTRFQHVSGEWVENSVFLDVQFKDPQGSGSLTTYGKRYGTSSLLSLNTEEDDDGNAAGISSRTGEQGAVTAASTASNRPPVPASEGQIKMIKDLAQERGVTIAEDEIFADKAKASAEIERLKALPRAGAANTANPPPGQKLATRRPASEKQLKLLERYAKEKGVTPDPEAMKDSGLISNEIDRIKALPMPPVTEAKVTVMAPVSGGSTTPEKEKTAEPAAQAEPAATVAGEAEPKAQAAVAAEAKAEAVAATAAKVETAPAAKTPVKGAQEATPTALSKRAQAIISKGDANGWKTSETKTQYAKFLVESVLDKTVTEAEAEYIRKRFDIPVEA